MKVKKLVTEANIQRICRLLDWNEAQYNDFQFNQGIDYLNEYCSGDGRIANQFAQHPNFWKWYRNHWNNRDIDFLRDANLLNRSVLVDEYKSLHCMAGFRFKPHRVVMDMSIYDKVIYPSTHQQEYAI